MNGCILWGVRVIVPPQGRQHVLNKLHDTHTGCCKMKALGHRYSAVDIEVATSTDFKPQTNSDNALADMAVESTVNSDSFTEQSSPFLAPTSTN